MERGLSLGDPSIRSNLTKSLRPGSTKGTRRCARDHVDQRYTGGSLRREQDAKKYPLHVAQLLTYLKLSGLSSGLIINWNVILLRDGIQRVVRSHPEELTEWINSAILS